LEKEPKNFSRALRALVAGIEFVCLRRGHASRSAGKSFLVLFFKKEPLSFLPCLGLTSLVQPATLGPEREDIHGTSSNTGASGVMAEG
jgi:hypothetical protein